MAKRKGKEVIEVKLHPKAVIPKQANEFAAGYDVKPVEVKMIAFNGWQVTCSSVDEIREACRELKTRDKRSLWKRFKDWINDERPKRGWKQLWFNSGIQMHPQTASVYMSAEPCSRTVKTDYVLHNSLGTIDNDYRGYTYFIYHSVCETYDEDKIILLFNTCGQLKSKYSVELEFEEKDELSETSRGDGGFGSTAKQ